MLSTDKWTIPGADGHPIIGDSHLPTSSPRGVVILAHGFKGYKDYGFFPRLAQSLADAGFIAHRFNFSHSGMTNDIATFARPDLFERDTWNKQVFDLRAVVEAMANGALAGQRLPYVLFGHSRGGDATLLAAGRFADDPTMAQPAGVVTAAAPNRCDVLNAAEKDSLRQEGFVESPSSRTGQRLRIGLAFLEEQIADPAGHDLLSLANRIRCPVLILHGEEDATVPVECADSLARAVPRRAKLVTIPKGDHVFNTPNPMPLDQQASVQLRAMIDAVTDFASSACSVILSRNEGR